MTASPFIEVPTGSTNVSESTPPMGWKNLPDETECDVFPISTTFVIDDQNTDALDVTLPYDLDPWEILVCTFVNDNTAFVKIIKETTNPVQIGRASCRERV